MEVFKCGTEVVTKSGKIEAIITAACIRFEKVQYELSYFLNGERKEVWLDEREFTTDSIGNKIPVGFRNGLKQ